MKHSNKYIIIYIYNYSILKQIVFFSFEEAKYFTTITYFFSGERPYVCNYCGRGFCESGNLKKHLRVHGKDIPAVIRANNKGKGVEKTEGIDTTYPPGEAYIGHAMNPVIKQVRPRGKGRKQVPPVPLPDSDHDQLKEEEGIVTHDEVIKL